MARDARLPNVALAGGVGTASGLAYLQFFQDLARWSALEVVSFFLGTAIIAWLAWRFVEPFFAALFLTHRLATPARHAPRHLSIRRYAKIFVVVLTTAVSAETLVHALTHGTSRIVLWAATIVMYGLVTYSWGRGAAQEPPRAGRWGGVAGLAVGAVVSAVTGSMALWLGIPGFFPGTRTAGIASVAGYSAGGALSMAIRGFAGGKAIDFRSRLPVGLRVAIGVGLVTVLQGIPAAVMGVPDWWSRIIEALGWGAGLLLYSDTEVVLGGPDERHALPATPAPPGPGSDAGPVATTRDASSKPGATVEVNGHRSGRREQISVAMGGGIGAASGVAYANFIDDVRTWEAVQILSFFLVTGIVAWLAWRFMEPFFAALFLDRRLPVGAEPKGRRRHFGKAFLAVLTSAVTLEVLLHALTSREGNGFLVWLAAVIMFTTATYGWTRGAQHRPPRSGRAGAIAGALVGAATLGILGLFVGGAVVFPQSQPFGTSSERNIVDAISLAFTGLVTMAPRGYGGGKAIDLGGRLPVGIRVILGVTAIVLAQIAVDYLGMVAFALPASPWRVWILEAIGWGVGVLLCPYSETVFGRSREDLSPKAG